MFPDRQSGQSWKWGRFAPSPPALQAPSLHDLFTSRKHYASITPACFVPCAARHQKALHTHTRQQTASWAHWKLEKPQNGRGVAAHRVLPTQDGRTYKPPTKDRTRSERQCSTHHTSQSSDLHGGRSFPCEFLAEGPFHCHVVRHRHRLEARPQGQCNHIVVC